MSWSLFHERNALMAKLIERAQGAGGDADAALRFDEAELADVRRLFGDEDTLMLALRHRWMTSLVAKLEQASALGLPAAQVRAELAAARPGLRALLDAGARRSVRLRAAERGENRVLDYFDGPALRFEDVVA